MQVSRAVYGLPHAVVPRQAGRHGTYRGKPGMWWPTLDVCEAVVTSLVDILGATEALFDLLSKPRLWGGLREKGLKTDCIHGSSSRFQRSATSVTHASLAAFTQARGSVSVLLDI